MPPRLLTDVHYADISANIQILYTFRELQSDRTSEIIMIGIITIKICFCNMFIRPHKKKIILHNINIVITENVLLR